MNTAEDGRRTPTYDEKKSTPTTTVDDVNAHGTSEVVDAATEARLLAKLDRRLVPMISWIYLMNFMDRGKHTFTFLVLRPADKPTNMSIASGDDSCGNDFCYSTYLFIHFSLRALLSFFADPVS